MNTGQPTYTIPKNVLLYAVSNQQVGMLRVFCALKRHTASDGKITLYYSKIGKYLGMHPDTVKRHVTSLLELGWMHKDNNQGNRTYFIRSWKKVANKVGSEVLSTLSGTHSFNKVVIIPEKYILDGKNAYLNLSSIFVLEKLSRLEHLRQSKKLFKYSLSTGFPHPETYSRGFLLSCETIGNWFSSSKVHGSRIRTGLANKGLIEVTDRFELLEGVTAGNVNAYAIHHPEQDTPNIHLRDGKYYRQVCSQVKLKSTGGVYWAYRNLTN